MLPKRQAIELLKKEKCTMGFDIFDIIAAIGFDILVAILMLVAFFAGIEFGRWTERRKG